MRPFKKVVTKFPLNHFKMHPFREKKKKQLPEVRIRSFLHLASLADSITEGNTLHQT